MIGRSTDWGRIPEGNAPGDKYPRWLRVVILFGGIVLSWSLLIKAADSLF